MKLVCLCLCLAVFLSTVYATAFDSTRQTYLVSEHNRARRDAVPPPITAMTTMTWSSASATQANSWANQCNYRHSYVSGFGENIMAGSGFRTQAAVSADAFDGWEEEESGFAFDSNGNVVCTHSQTCGHYTQIVWANTTRVGCAWAHCSINSPFLQYGITDWTFVVCNYETPGNVMGQKPYFPCLSGSCGASATPTRTRTPTPSQTRVAASATPTRSPTRSLTRTPTRTPTRSVVIVGVTPTRTPTPTRTRSLTPTRTPAVASATPTRTRSRTPSRSNACNCGQNMQCVNNVCTCLSGYTLVNGACTIPTSGGTPSWATDFSQIGVGGMTIPDVVLIQQTTGSNLVRWDRSASVVDKYNTKHTATIRSSTGTFSLAFRVGQSTRSSDRVEFRWSNINGATATMEWCAVYYGTDYCSSFGSRSFPSANGLKLVSTMSYDDAVGNVVCTVVVGTTTYSGYTAGTGYPSLGALGYLFNTGSSSARPALSELTLATSRTLTVSLTDCIDSAEWSSLFYSLTGANPSTTSVQLRASGQNANCAKAANAEGKALVSGFTFVVTSTSVPAQALASTFLSSVGTPAADAAGISSAGLVAGSEGATAAGIPASTSALPGTVASTTAGAAAGGGGGAGGGLSGGAIAGIVIGSVAGAVLLVGVTALIVGAVIVGAVVLTRGDDDSSSSSPSPSEGGQRRSLRQTIRGFFGGVDVMNNPQNGHQSITARSPPVSV